MRTLFAPLLLIGAIWMLRWVILVVIGVAVLLAVLWRAMRHSTAGTMRGARNETRSWHKPISSTRGCWPAMIAVCTATTVRRLTRAGVSNSKAFVGRRARLADGMSRETSDCVGG